MSVSRFHVQALTLVALLGAAGACARGHDDDDLTVRGLVGPISDFPRPDAGLTVPDQGGGGSGASDGSASGGYDPPGPGDFGSRDAGVATPPFTGSDAGTSTAGDAGDGGSDAGPEADAGDAGSDADADADAAPLCWLLCP
jgi:hypothetical protein